MSILWKRKNKATANLEQVTAIRDRVWSIRQQMQGREVGLTDLFSMLGEDERKAYWSAEEDSTRI
jgi:hypothetical protein